MFVPEYTITSKTLKNITITEYSKAIIESTVILPSWERQLKHQTEIDEIFANLQLEGMYIEHESVKRILDNVKINNSAKLVLAYQAVIDSINTSEMELSENYLKKINQMLTEKEEYRSKIVENKANPEEILAEIVELFDWLNSLDAKDSHPIIVLAIACARLHAIMPFEKFNESTINLAQIKIQSAFNYSLKNTISISTYFNRSKKAYLDEINKIPVSNNDYTQWIEYFSEAFATQASTAQEKVKLLAKDTKVAKASGRNKLSPRQERIVEYLQDYGLIQNSDFSKLFPEKSEDSVLRDLKALVDKGIVKKMGSTKSSRYELA